MRVKFNKFERVAGLFVLMALVGSVAATMGIAVQKGWFSSKVEFEAVLDSADGIHSGTVVQVAGLRAGSVKEVDLLSANEVLVKFEVLEKFHSRIRKDSSLQVIRPFIIGEKVFDVSVGSEEAPKLLAGGRIEVKQSMDIMDLMSGKKLAPFLGTIEDLTSNLQLLAKAFADKERTEAFIKIFDRLNPLLNNVDRMSQRIISVTDVVMKGKRLDQIVGNLNGVISELNVIVPQMTKESPEIGKQLSLLMTNITELTNEFKKLTPAISAVAPELPDASRRALEALDETVITLKAIQKSFLLRGSVEDVKEEEALRKRQPAGVK